MVEVDVRGLSCPEPVMLTMDAIKNNPGETIKVIGTEAHTKANIEAMLKHKGKKGTAVDTEDGFEITIEA